MEVGDTVMFDGQDMIGGRAEVTVIVKEHDDDLLALSVAVQPTVRVPIGKSEPDVALQLDDLIPELSLAVTVKLTTAPLEEDGTTFMLAGQAMDGGEVSVTNTANEQLLLSLALSMAVQVTLE